MGCQERRTAIMEFMAQNRQSTIDELCREFHVSRSTIKRDILALTCTYPLYTTQGRYGGGVFLENWWYPSRNTLAPKQVEVLRRLAAAVDDEDRAVLNSIITQFTQMR